MSAQRGLGLSAQRGLGLSAQRGLGLSARRGLGLHGPAVCMALALMAPATVQARRSERSSMPRTDLPLAQQSADAAPIAITNGTLHPVTSPPLAATLLLEHGRIVRILPVGRPVPSGYELIDATGRHVYPGLVAAGAPGLGLSGDTYSEDIRKGRRRVLANGFDAWSENVELAASGGITTALVFVPPYFSREASGPLAGRAALLKMSYEEPRGTLLREPAAILAGPSLLGAEGRFQFDELVRGLREGQGAGTGSRSKPSPDEEDVRALLARDLPLITPADDPSALSAAIDLARTHHLRLIVYQPVAGWALAPQLLDVGASVIQHVRAGWNKNRDDRRTALSDGWRFDMPAVLTAAGVPTAVLPMQDAISMGGLAGRDLRDLAMEAAFAQRGGLTPEQALEAITIVPARLYGVEDRVGSLRAGLDADVIIADGDILDYRTIVRTTIVNGKVVYEAEGNRWWGWITERRDADLERIGAPRPAPRKQPAAPVAPTSAGSPTSAGQPTSAAR